MTLFHRTVEKFVKMRFGQLFLQLKSPGLTNFESVKEFDTKLVDKVAESILSQKDENVVKSDLSRKLSIFNQSEHDIVLTNQILIIKK